MIKIPILYNDILDKIDLIKNTFKKYKKIKIKWSEIRPPKYLADVIEYIKNLIEKEKL